MAEWAFSVHSTHSAPHLVLLSEFLPHVADEGIKLELLQPTPESTLQVRLYHSFCVLLLLTWLF